MKNEIWKDVVGYEGCYMISSLGRLKSIDRVVTMRDNSKHILKSQIKALHFNKKKYYVSTISKLGIKDSRPIHRLVAEAFIPNPENKPFVNHINGIKTDNRIVNLEWCTHVENMHHANSMGLLKNCGKLDKQTALAIREIFNAKPCPISQIDMARYLNVSGSLICAILKKRTWAHI